MREKLLAGISESPVPEALITQTEIGDMIDQAGDERDRELSLLLSGRDKEKLMPSMRPWKNKRGNLRHLRGVRG